MIDSYLQDSAFTAVKRDAKFSAGCVKGVPFVNRRYTEGVPFCEKWYLKGWRVWPPGWASPYKHLFSNPSPQGGQHLPSSAISSHQVLSQYWLGSEEKIHNLIVVTSWSSWWVEKNDLPMVTESFWNLSNRHICKVHKLIDISFKDKLKIQVFTFRSQTRTKLGC